MAGQEALVWGPASNEIPEKLTIPRGRPDLPFPLGEAGGKLIVRAQWDAAEEWMNANIPNEQ